MKFVAIDVETANPDMSSICQIGAVKFADGSVVDELVTYLNPQSFFDFHNSSIHGIDEGMVQNAPLFVDFLPRLINFVEDLVVVSHTHFDRVALQQATGKVERSLPMWRWLDSARVTRKTWSQFSSKGYGLANVCNELNIEFKHHDALEDAKAAGYVLQRAMEYSQIDLDDWIAKAAQPISQFTSPPAKREGNPDGVLFGEVVVFTGQLEMPRREAADMAASLGCEVVDSVSKKTTILIVGDQDVTRLAGATKSSKHRKAEGLMSETGIRILKESDFLKLVQMNAR